MWLLQELKSNYQKMTMENRVGPFVSLLVEGILSIIRSTISALNRIFYFSSLKCQFCSTIRTFILSQDTFLSDFTVYRLLDMRFFIWLDDVYL